jgi:hypothetical protein
MREEGEGKRDTNMMIRSPIVTETRKDLGRGFSFPGTGSYDSQKGFDCTVEKIWSKWLKEARGKRTTIQIQCPDIIETRLGGPATEDEELGTDQRHGMEVTTAGPGAIDHDAGPLSRYWNTRNSDWLERALTSIRSDVPRFSRYKESSLLWLCAFWSPRPVLPPQIKRVVLVSTARCP